jgi:hypothetical protein
MRCTLEEWQKTQTPLEEYIYNCSTQDGSDGWLPFTIGIGWQIIMLQTETIKDTQIGPHDKLVLNATHSYTDAYRRPTGKNRISIMHTLESKGIYNEYGIEYNEYMNRIPQYKFIISPEGNGVDCHRHYEALMAGCIPIIETHEGIKQKYAGCPILYTYDYTEITEDYLNQKYQEMIGETWDFSCLFLSSYDSDTQSRIRENGNYWANRPVGKSWYE